MKPLRLFYSLRSPFARRVRLVLEELSIPYESAVTDVFQPSAEFLRANPLGRVPVLELPTGEFLCESWEILDWLRVRHSSHSLFQMRGRSEVALRQVSALSVGVMELTVSYFLESLKPVSQRSFEGMTESLSHVRAALGAVVPFVRQPYLTGEAISVWDLDLGAALGYCDLRLGREVVDLLPELRALSARLDARPSFQKTRPPAA